MQVESSYGTAAGFRNVLLVTFDTTRADRIGCYGYSEARTPALDLLARQGILFERCVATAPITLPSHASILTGLYPFRHGARNNGTHRLGEPIETLAETLSAAGFDTGAVVSAMVLDSRWGLDQGFDHYDDDLANAENAPLFMYRETKAADTARRAVHWLEQRGDERFFLWLHFFDPHANYEAPEAIAAHHPDTREGRYDAEIEYTDAALALVLDTLHRRGVLDQTLVVMTADHGESLGEHGESTHSLFIYDATTRVPLIFRHPALAAGKRIPETVSSVDIAPTILELLDVSARAAMDGQSLARSLHAGVSPLQRAPVYSEAMNPYYNHGWSDLRGVSDEQWRYIRAPRPELYDLRNDRWEENNLHRQRPGQATRYERVLQLWLAEGERDQRGEDLRSLDAKTRAALEELGYVWTSNAPPEAERSQPLDRLQLRDPKDGVALQERMQHANELVRQERYRDARELLEKIVQEEPQATLSRSALAGVLDKLGEKDAARELLLHLARSPAARVTTLLQLARLERELGHATWPQHLEAAKALQDRDPLPWVRQGDWAQEDGDPQRALSAYQRAIDIDSHCAQAWVGRGNSLHRLGRDREAEAALLNAVRLDSLAFEACYDLGVVQEALGHPDKAEYWYHEALRRRPDHGLSLVNLGNLSMRAGKSDLAERLYLAALQSDATDFHAHFNLGLLMRKQGRPVEASRHFSAACTARPEHAVARRQYQASRREALQARSGSRR